MCLNKHHFRIRNTAVQKETMMDVITMKECETLPMVIHIDRTAQIHKVHGSGTTKLRVHICRKFVRRREKTETINPERNIPVRIVICVLQISYYITYMRDCKFNSFAEYISVYCWCFHYSLKVTVPVVLTTVVRHTLYTLCVCSETSHHANYCPCYSLCD